MNPIPPEVETAGLRAYEQARAFEELERRRLPLIYGGLTFFILIGGMVMWQLKASGFAETTFLMALVFAVITIIHWRDLKRRHRRNLQLLKELEARYGEDLPWLQVERHLAAVEKLQEELREER